jgi:voltage-gated sodium channel
MRLLEVSSNLKVVERKIVSIIPTVFSFALLLGILLYIYSIIGIYLFGHHKFAMADFHDLPSAMLTLFQLMTLDGWAEVMESASIPPFDGWFYKGYFVSFVILTAIVSFNVFIAVLTSQVDEKMQEERRRSEDRITHQIEDVEDEVEEAEAELLKSMNVILKEVQNLKSEINFIKKNMKGE